MMVTIKIMMVALDNVRLNLAMGVRNEGPSICFNIDGWKITLTTFILEPTRVRITFSDQI